MRTLVRQPRRGHRTGFTLLEVMVALMMVVTVLVSSMFFVDRVYRSMRKRARVVSTEMRAHEMLNDLEQELAFARGYTPSTSLVATLGAATTDRVTVAATTEFPDRGMLLLDRGTASEERILYDRFDPVLGSFEGLTRDVQCTTPTAHANGVMAIAATEIACRTPARVILRHPRGKGRPVCVLRAGIRSSWEVRRIETARTVYLAVVATLAARG